jgi:putative drug exporter of the RND superfamily
MHSGCGVTKLMDHNTPPNRPRGARFLKVAAIPIILIWVAIAAVTNIFVPSLEETTKANAGAMVPRDAPSSQAAVHTGKAFEETEFTSAAVVLLETRGRKLNEGDHQYYDEVVQRLRRDHKAVQTVVDLWGQPVTKSGQQSADSEAATVTVYPAGDSAAADANASIESIREVIAKLPKPAGLDTFVTGPSALAADTLDASDKSMTTLTIVTIVMITAMLLLAYRSITVALIPLLGVLILLASARGIVSFAVEHHLIGISSYAANILVSLVLGVTTDYGIFFLGRYKEARQSGCSREDSYYISVAHTPHVVLGSGVAISGACLCLSLTKLDYFRTMGPALFISMVVAVVGALTLGPAVLAVGSTVKWVDFSRPRVTNKRSLWRRVGTSIARWPAAMIAVAVLVAPVCIVNLTSYTVSYNDRDFAPSRVESSQGYAAADRHFPKSQLSVDTIYVQSDHDLVNSTDMISLDRVAKEVIRVPGISLIQGVTRPNGRALQHGSLPYAMGSMGTKIGENIDFMDARAQDLGLMAAKIGHVIELTQQMKSLTLVLGGGTDISLSASEKMKAITDETRDSLANVDDFFRPLRSFLYWEKHCFDIPVCYALRSLNESTDSIDQLSEQLAHLVDGLRVIDAVPAQFAEKLDMMAADTRVVQRLTLTTQSLLNATVVQMKSAIGPMVDMAKAFDNAKNDDFFFLPPDALKTDDFQVGRHFFVTKDGKGARFIVFHHGEAMSSEGIAQARNALATAQEALKGTTLSDAKLYMAGSSSSYRDIKDFAAYDTVIMMLATFSLVFIIVLLITRALVGAIIVTLTVMLSFAASFGLSVFIWETVLGAELHWLTLPISFMVLVAVGSDYNLLLLSRYREELVAGIQTGVVRTMGTSGSVAVTASFVFAFTMLALLSSDVVSIGQVGATICLGIILDMLVFRFFLVMPVARLLGRWFWWPQSLGKIGARG